MSEYAPSLLTACLAVAVMFLLITGAASLLALFRGTAELRRLFRSASQDLSSLLLKSPLTPGVSVIAVVSDASQAARSLVRRLLDLHAARQEVIVVLNGVSGAALQQWVAEFHLDQEDHTLRSDVPGGPVRGCWVSRDPFKLMVLEKDAGSEADARNAAVNAAQHEVIAMVDPRADFVPQWPLRLMRPLLANWERSVAVCAVAVAMPAPVDTLTGRLGALEALRRWIVRGAAFAEWRKLVPIPGSCMLIKREAIVRVGGFRGSELELFLDLQAARQHVVFLPDAVSWTRPPETMSEVRGQIRYDQAQLARGLRYRAARAGGEFTGLFCVRVLRPVIETAALAGAAAGILLGWVHPALAGLVLVASAGVGMTLSMAAVVLREVVDPGARDPQYLRRLFLTAILENVGYRYLRNLWLIGAFWAR